MLFQLSIKAKRFVALVPWQCRCRDVIHRDADVDVAVVRRVDCFRPKIESAFRRRRAEEILSAGVEVAVDEWRRREEEVNVVVLNGLVIRRVFDVEIRRRLNVAADVDVDVVLRRHAGAEMQSDHLKWQPIAEIASEFKWQL